MSANPLNHRRTADFQPLTLKQFRNVVHPLVGTTVLYLSEPDTTTLPKLAAVTNDAGEVVKTSASILRETKVKIKEQHLRTIRAYPAIVVAVDALDDADDDEPEEPATEATQPAEPAQPVSETPGDVARTVTLVVWTPNGPIIAKHRRITFEPTPGCATFLPR